jgi:hypothetical protein
MASVSDAFSVSGHPGLTVSDLSAARAFKQYFPGP